MESPLIGNAPGISWSVRDRVVHFAIATVSQTLEEACDKFILQIDGSPGVVPGYVKTAIKSLGKLTEPMVIWIVNDKEMGAKSLNEQTVGQMMKAFEDEYRKIFGHKDEYLEKSFDFGTSCYFMLEFSLKLWAVVRILEEYREKKAKCNKILINSIISDCKIIYRFLFKMLDTEVAVKRDGKEISRFELIY